MQCVELNRYFDESKYYPANIYLFKINKRNIRKNCDICSKLTIKTPERRHWRRFVVFIVNFEHILHLLLVFLLLTLKQHGTIIRTYYSQYYSSMEAVNVSWILYTIINHGSVIYSLAQNICRLFFVLAQCLFARSET